MPLLFGCLIRAPSHSSATNVQNHGASWRLADFLRSDFFGILTLELVVLYYIIYQI